MGLVKVFTKLVTKHLYVLLSYVPVDHWAALGWAPPEAGWVLLLAPLWLQQIISAKLLLLQTAETGLQRGSDVPGVPGEMLAEQWWHKMELRVRRPGFEL